MLKQTVALLAPVAAVVAIAMMPTMASADCRYQPGTPHTPPYCLKFCKVPKLKGKTPKQARAAIRAHDCRVGKVKRKERDKDRRGNSTKDRKESKKAERPRVSKQSPKAGKSFAAGHKVNFTVKG